MKRILIFSGTTEGRKLAETLADAGVPAVVCVATDYGTQVMEPLSGITLHQGRMSREEMRTFMEQEPFLAVADATHPFAKEVSENIRQSAAVQKIPYLRLKRSTKSGSAEENETCCASHEECKEALLLTTGNILLTTGSKDLAVYCESEKLRERIYARVLPSEESIALCRNLGLKGRQILAMQGPFSKELNLALVRQYGIRCLVTKESGTAGGFEEKKAAARQMGIRLFVIGNPEKQEGMSFGEVCETLERMTGRTIKETRELCISLVGIGMGGRGTLTEFAKEHIQAADCLFGANRILQCVREWGILTEEKPAYPYYREEEIIPVLEENLSAHQDREKVVVLFSGDSGFYSGGRNLYQKLEQWAKNQPQKISVQMEAGISSVSYFAAACHMSWQDAKIMSIHGKGARKEWEAELLSAVTYEKKVFLLVSGAADVRAVGAVLEENGLSDCRILLGYQLSSPEERIAEYRTAQCRQIEKEGLYILAILRENSKKRQLAPQKRDEEFERGKVPMTKEEIRELAVCKMRLKEYAVVWDIGSGTGSVAVELAACSETIRVCAVEQNEEGVRLIEANRKKFGLFHLEVIRGKAPDCLEELPIPTHAFIGGSGGRLKEILEVLYRKNPAMRVVMTAVTLETMGEMTGILEKFPVTDVEIIQVQVSRAEKAGRYHLMRAENPVCLCSFNFRGS